MSLAALALQQLPVAAPARVLACGAWLKNTACLLDGHSAWLSPVCGDLGSFEARMQLVDAVARLQQQASGPIEAVAHDMHPDFFSTEFAQQLAHTLGVPAIAVQHHHAHLAQVQAQHAPQGTLVGWALDGVGLGSDGTAWGGELLLLDGARFQRLAHLPALALPGGDVAAQEPWRMAMAVLHRLQLPAEAVLADAGVPYLRAGGLQAVAAASRKGVAGMLQRDLHCPQTTSAGRWFDAVAGLLGVCWWQTEEAMAAVALERLAAQWFLSHEAPALPSELISAGLDLDPLVRQLLALRSRAADDADADADADSMLAMQQEGAALFHVALADALARAAIAAAQAHAKTQVQAQQRQAVALSGGCFINGILRTRMEAQLRAAGCTPLVPFQLDCGDAGLSLGQAWAAAQVLTEQAGPAHNHSKRNSLCV